MYIVSAKYRLCQTGIRDNLLTTHSILKCNLSTITNFYITFKWNYHTSMYIKVPVVN